MANHGEAVGAERTARIALLVLQPTPFCNISCDYCYLPNRSDPHRLDDVTLRAALQFVIDSQLLGDDLTIVWHAGEPLVVGPAFYEKAFATVAEVMPAHASVRHAFQTNGLLLDARWCELFREHDVRLGLSIDGPQLLHDARRKTRSGGGTFIEAMRGLDLVKRAGLDFHLISVLTHETLRAPEALFDFYVENAVRHVAFNIEEVEGVHTSSSLQTDDTEHSYRRFLTCFLTLMADAHWPFTLRELDAACGAILRRPESPRNAQTDPWTIVSIDSRGEIGTFSPELLGQHSQEYGTFSLGNVLSSNFKQVSRSLRFLAMADAVKLGVESCRASCHYFSLCGGGAPANKFAEHQSLSATETMFCRLTQQVTLDVVMDLLETAMLAPHQTPIASATPS